ncbi:phosphatidate cytidylyltransferase [Thermovibrio sp.]
MKSRVLGALLVVFYALLMFLLPYNYYYALVYLLGVLVIAEIFTISSQRELTFWGILLFSAVFYLAVNYSLILDLLSYYYSSYFLFFHKSLFFSYLILLIPLIFSLFLLTVSLIHYGKLKEGFFPSLFFVIYSTFGLISLAKLTKPYFLLLLALVWSTDTFAYLVGKYFGRKRVVPSISPKKTFEGFVGGSFFGTITSIAVSHYLNLLSLPLPSLFLLFFLLTLVSQLGDLLESGFKRLFNVKDSGSLIPGHGGVLDRLDSTLTVAPIIFVVGGLS